MMWKLRNFIFRLTHPSFWIQNHAICWKWDEDLWRLLDKEEVVRVDSFTVMIGGVEVWVSNYPYDFGHKYVGSRKTECFLPSPLTRVRLAKIIKERGI